MKKTATHNRYFVTAFLILISLILISFLSCKTTKQDVQKYVAKNPEIKSEICDKQEPAKHKTDTVIEIQFIDLTDSVAQIKALNELRANINIEWLCKYDSLEKLYRALILKKYPVKMVTIHDSIPYVDYNAINEAVKKQKIADDMALKDELNKKDIEISQLKTTRNVLGWCFFIFALIAAVVVYLLLRKRNI